MAYSLSVYIFRFTSTLNIFDSHHRAASIAPNETRGAGVVEGGRTFGGAVVQDARGEDLHGGGSTTEPVAAPPRPLPRLPSLSVLTFPAFPAFPTTEPSVDERPLHLHLHERLEGPAVPERFKCSNVQNEETRHSVKASGLSGTSEAVYFSV